MSREDWYAGMAKGTAPTLFASLGTEPRKLSSLTSDPEAADHDEACELFLQGLRLARCGDFAAAVPQIACAYLLDSRSVKFIPKLPADSEAFKKNYVLDCDLLGKLIDHDNTTFGSNVLRILLATHLGKNPSVGQQLIAAAMVHINNLYEYIEDNPSVEAPDSHILGGCLTRKILLRERSSLYMAMGNYKSAIKDLTKALKIDENWTWARESRACIWGSTKFKGYDVLHKEFKRVISESHEDHRGNEVSYAWLALSILNDRSLGSFEDAKGYYEKCKAASARRAQIYGERSQDSIPPPVKLVRQSFGDQPLDPEQIINCLQNLSLGAESGLESHRKKLGCVKCGARSNKQGGRLHQCSRCHVAHYCSRECQVDDWKNHKEFCAIMKNDRKARKDKVPTAEVVEKPTQTIESDVSTETSENDVAQEKQDQWTSNILMAKRLETEFSAVFKMYGKGFSEWWSAKNQGEKKDLLIDVTHASIPLNEVPKEEITRLLGQPSPMMSRALYDYNVQSLCSNGRLLHEMDEWATNAEKKDQQNIDLSIEYRNKGIFPDLFNGNVAFVMPPDEGELIGPPNMFNNTAPESEVNEFRELIEQGHLYDASAVQFAVSRKIFSLSLFVILFDEYQVQVRRVASKNPYERLVGCRHCDRSCQADTSKFCSTCKVSWFCCRGCMAAAGHMRCPLGVEQDMKVMFN